MTLGRAYFAEGITKEKQQSILAHEIVHSYLKAKGITGEDFVKTGLFGKHGAVNAEEAVTQMMSDLFANPNFVEEHPNMPAANKARYEYVKTLMPQTEAVSKPAEKQPVAEKTEKPQEKIKPSKEAMAKALEEGKNITQAAEEYVETDEGKEEFEKYKADSLLMATDIQERLDKFVDDPVKFYHEKRIFEVEMEIYKIFAKKLESIPYGKDVNRYVAHIMEIIANDKPEDVIKKIERSFKKDDLFHEVFTDKAAAEEARAITERENASGNFGIDHYVKYMVNHLSRNEMITKTQHYLIGEYLQRLYALPDGAGNAEAARIVKKIGRIATEMGRGIQGIGAMYKMLAPEYHAEQIIKAWNKVVEDTNGEEKNKELQKVVSGNMENVKKVRKQAIDDVAKGLDNAVLPIKKDKTIRMKLTTAESFANRIMRDLETKPPEIKLDIEKQVKMLFMKYREIVPHKKGKTDKESAINLLSELVLNREKYTKYWQDARGIIYLNETMNAGEGMTRENFEKAQNYFKLITSPDYIKKIVDRAVVETIASMDMTVSEFARNFFITGEESISAFTDAIREHLKSNGIVMDETSYARMEKYMISNFRFMVETKHQADIKAFMKQIDRYSSRKISLSEQEQIVKQITQATYYNVFDDAESAVYDIWTKKLGIPHMTAELRDIIYDSAREIAKATDERTKNQIYDRMVFRISQVIPSTGYEKAQAWLRTAMLLNPTTWMRNMISNLVVRPYYHGMDALTNYYMHRMKDIPTDEMIAGTTVKKFKATDEIGKAVLERTDEATVKRLQAKFAKYSLGQLFGMEKRIFKTKWLQDMTTIPYSIMSTGQYKNFKFRPLGDIYMFQYWLREGMYNKMLALGYSESMTAEQKQEIVDTATEYGTQLATARTFRTVNILSNMIKSLQQSASKHGKYGKSVAMGLRIATPFVVTPAALTAEAYKFSPIALAKAVLLDYGVGHLTGKWKTRDSSYKADYAKRVSQALVGTAGQFIIGAILSAFGLLTGASPEDGDEKKQWEAEGKKPYSIFIPGVGYFSIDWLQPISTGIMAGAQTFQTIFNSDKSAFEKVASPITSSLDVLFKTSILQNVSQQFGTDYGKSGTASEMLLDFGKSAVFQGLPAVVKKLNRVIDPYVRNTYSGDAVQVFFQRILEYVPGGTFAIPKKIDVWGKPVMQTKATVGGAFGRFVINMTMPFTYSQDKMDNVTKEVTRVFNETKATMGAKALPSISDKKITRTKNGVKTEWELTAQEYIDLQEKIGKESYSQVESLIARSDYKGMTDQEKANALAKIYSNVGEKMRNEYVKAHQK
jgi:hypothetical protein